jgi:hypothetical protein
MNDLVPVERTEIAPEILELVFSGGDLSKLKPAERLAYIAWWCGEVQIPKAINPLIFIRTDDGKVRPYSTKATTDYLRKRDGVTIKILEQGFKGDYYIVRVAAKAIGGREDEDLGVVAVTDKMGPKMRGNMMMTAVTKAKRRVTLSICGMGMTDESEMADVPGAKPLKFDPETGELSEEMRAPTIAEIKEGGVRPIPVNGSQEAVDNLSKADKAIAEFQAAQDLATLHAVATRYQDIQGSERERLRHAWKARAEELMGQHK